MRPLHFLVVLRLSVLAALAASAALFVDYTQATPTFCGAGSGCAAVRRSGFGYLPIGDLYVPLPVFGLLGFAALFIVSTLGKPALRRKLVLAFGLPGALVAIVLLYLQARIGAFCSLCVTADLAALLAGAAALGYGRALDRASPDAAETRDLKLWAWLSLGILAAASPFVWHRVRPVPPIPESVRALYVPEKINVVEFADFECPFCRELHPRLKAVLEPYKDRVHCVRLNFPLDSHPFAAGAAKAAVCAAAQNKGDEMADILFAAEDLSVQANRRTAVELGLDMARFDVCLNDKATEKTIREQRKVLEDADFQGLPTTFIQDKQLIGAQPDEMFRDALERAARKERRSGIDGVRFVLLTLGLAFAVASFGRPKPKKHR